MSFIDLATLALHRRSEMEVRIKSFVSKCDQAIEDIVKLKVEAQGFVNHLNCDPSVLKERFLQCMRTLDEYTYLITDISLSVGRLEELKSSIDFTPVQDVTARQNLPLTPAYNNFNIMDMLSEPAPSTSTACPNRCPLEHKVKKKSSKEEQTLIVFSSTSCSSESVPANEVKKKEKEVQCELTEAVEKISITDPIPAEQSTTSSHSVEPCNLPAQTVLQTEQVYAANIMSIDGTSFWIIAGDNAEANNLMKEMTVYYKDMKNKKELSLEEIKTLIYCAYYDDETDWYYRGLFLGLSEKDASVAEVFLVDTGEVVQGPARAVLQPLAAHFYRHPPFARCCHLVGVDLTFHIKEAMAKQEQFLSQFIGAACSIEVDDNTSESLGVYVILPQNETLNDLLVKNGLAWSTSPRCGPEVLPTSSEKASPPEQSHSSVHAQGPPELAAARSSDLDIDGPEYDDPVEAIMGYSCRDEAEVCKHYKGGPEKTCFKGARCKKKHIVLHPDGWTLDKIEAIVGCPMLSLPAPGKWLRALVTCVAHFDRLFVHLVKEKGQLDDDPLPEFGVILPPTNLNALVKDMNSPATRLAYKPLKVMPAEGELVAALYPPDSQWYRARVMLVNRADQDIQVMYIDYGNQVFVKEDAIRALDPRFIMLPAQAVRCRLAGVAAKGDDSRTWAAARQLLTQMTLERELDIQVISCDGDEISVAMFDEEGYSVAEQLAASNLVTLRDYSVQDDAYLPLQPADP